MKKKSDIDMLSGTLWKNILQFSVPIMLTTLLQYLFHSADLIVVGNFASSESLAAVGATGSISGLVISLFMGLSVGAGVTAAHAIGSRDEIAVHQAIHSIFPLAFISGILLTAFGIPMAKPLLILMDTPTNILDQATLYMQIYFAGITAIMVYNFGSAILRAAGDSKSPLIYLSIAGGLNVVLNIIFVAAFKMDVAGVALATALTNVLSAVLVVRALMRREDACRLFLNKMRFYKAPFLKILRIGIPSGIQTSLFSFANTIIQSSINSFGSTVMSGSAAASNIEQFITIGSTAFSQAAINFTGQNMGASNYKRIKKILYCCLVQVLVMGILLGATAYFLREPLLKIYLPDAPEARYWGGIRMQIMTLLYPIAAIMDITANVIRGMGKSLLPTLVSVFCICGIRLIWIFFVFPIPAFHNYPSIYWSFPISWLLAFAVHYITYLCSYRTLLKKGAEK